MPSMSAAKIEPRAEKRGDRIVDEKKRKDPKAADKKAKARAEVMQLLWDAGAAGDGDYYHRGHHEHSSRPRRPGTAYHRPGTAHPSAGRRPGTAHPRPASAFEYSQRLQHSHHSHHHHHRGPGYHPPRPGTGWAPGRGAYGDMERPVARHGQRGDVATGVDEDGWREGWYERMSLDSAGGAEFHEEVRPKKRQGQTKVVRLLDERPQQQRDYKGSLEGWLHGMRDDAFGYGHEADRDYFVKRTKEDAKKKILTVEQQEEKAWRGGAKLLANKAAVAKAEEERKQKLKKLEMEREARAHRPGYGYMHTTDAYLRERRRREEEDEKKKLGFKTEEGLDRLVWKQSGKVLTPFERAAADQAVHEGRQREAGWPGRADVAWRVHGKAAWVGEAIDERHAEHGEAGLKRGCKNSGAAKREAGVFGNEGEHKWIKGGKVVEAAASGGGRDAVWGTKVERDWAEGGKVLDAVQDGGAEVPYGQRLGRENASVSARAEHGSEQGGVGGGDAHLKKKKGAEAGLVDSMARLGGGGAGGVGKEIAPMGVKQHIEVFDAPWKAWKDKAPLQPKPYSHEPRANYKPDEGVGFRGGGHPIRTAVGLVSARKNAGPGPAVAARPKGG